MSGGWGAPTPRRSSFGPQVIRSAGMDLSVEDRQADQLMEELLQAASEPVDLSAPRLSCQQTMFRAAIAASAPEG